MVMIPLPADRDEWLKLRGSYVGASESPALLGPEFSADYQLSAYALHYIKEGRIESPFVENERTKWGTRLERSIAEGISEDEGWVLHPGMFAIDDDGRRMSASLDFIIDPNEQDLALGYTGQGALEIKNVDAIQFWKKWDGGDPPPWISIQVQHQLGCSGLTWGAVGALVGGNRSKVLRVQRNQQIIDVIRRAVDAFWEGVDTGVPPDLDEKESTAYAVRALFPETIGDKDEPYNMMADNELPDLCSQERDWSERFKQADQEAKRLRNAIRAKIGKRRAVLVNGFKVSRSIGADVPDRPAIPGEIIRGRRGQDRLTISPVRVPGQ